MLLSDSSFPIGNNLRVAGMWLILDPKHTAPDLTFWLLRTTLALKSPVD